MNRILVTLTLGCSLVAHADGDCKKERPPTKAELAFYDRAKSSAKALPAAPEGWAQHPEEITAPAKLCADADPMLKKGEARFNVVAETEYRDNADHTSKIELAMKFGTPSAEEAKKAAELNKKIDGLRKLPPDAGAAAQIVAAQTELLKISTGQTERVNLALREASHDGQARIRVSFNPASENSTGCGSQKTVVATKLEAVAQAFSGTCDLSSSPQESENGVLLLFGPWKVKSDASALEATSTFDPKKPAPMVQTLSVVIIGDGQRPEQLLKGLDVKALAALVGK